jgi:hypothetical protein
MTQIQITHEQALRLRQELRRTSRQYRELIGEGHDDSECLDRSLFLDAIAEMLKGAN